MQRTRSRRSHGFLQAFRRWAPWVAHLALAAVLNTAFNGPTWADEIGRHRALEASLVAAERVPSPPSLDELVALLTPALERALASGLPTQRPSLPAVPSPPVAPRIAAFSPPPALAAPLLSATVAAAAPAPPLPPPPSIPGLPRDQSRVPAPASAVEAATISGDGVPLLPGWNLISLPRPPDSVDPAAVFSSIAGSFAIVHTYNACDATDPWRTYDPAAAPGANDLTSVDHRPGLWVRATAAATLALSGTEPAETSIQLCQGWNLIGYPLAQPRPVPAALSSIAGKFRRVYGWDPADPIDPWEVFDVAVPAWANDLELMQPGRGYWLYATQDTTLVFSNAGLPPEVEITAPANAAVITAPTDVVGSVTSDLLERWTLAYRLKGETGAFTIFASGNTPVASGVLGKFDPTLLLNGLYEIELTATDFQGQSVSTSIDVVVEGNLKVGHFTLSFVDLEVPLAGLPIQVLRTYDSRDKRLGDFGIGWRVSVSNVRLQEDGPVGEKWQGVRSGGAFPNYCVFPTHEHQVTITLPDDKVFRFRPKLTPECQLLAPPQVVNISYVPLPGTLGTLEMLDQNPQALVVGSFPGAVQLWDQDGVELEDPGRYRLTTQDGRKFVVDQTAGLTSLTDLNENTLTFNRDGITHSSGEGVAFERDAQGKITTITDPEGERLTYFYNTTVDLVAVTDRAEATTRFTYNNNHYLLSIQDPLGRQPIRNEYDAAGRLISTTDAFGKTADLTHNLEASREIITDRQGHSSILEYDARGNIIRETDPLGKTTLRTFDANNLLLAQTDPLGNTTTYSYDASQNLIEKVDPLENRARYTHNANGQVLTETDARGKTTFNTYDSRGNLLSRTDPMGNVTSSTYDSRGNLLSGTDPEGATTRYTYDAAGNVVTETDAIGTQTRSTYDANGNRLTRTTIRTTPAGPETITWSYTYDAQGHLTQTTYPDGTTTRSLRNPLGNLTESTDQLGRRTTYTYDLLGRLLQTHYPDGTIESSTYDTEGRRLTSINRAGHMTINGYDALGRPTSTLHPDGARTISVYDDVGRLTASTDARGNTTAYEYDAAGRLTKIRNALEQEKIFAYDANGNQISVTDARGNTTRYHYDDMNRMIRVFYPDGTSTQTDYDRAGREISEVDAAGRTKHFSYDALGRLTSVMDALNQETRFTYDEQGNLISQIDANRRATRFEYDKLRRPTKRVLPDGRHESFTYDAAGHRTSRTDFNGATTVYRYDINSRLVERRYPDGSTVIFTYTPTGQRASAVDRRGTTAYSYDLRDRLTSLINPDGAQLAYTYDPHGNQTALTAQIDSSVLTTRYTYNALNQLQSVIDHEGNTYTYTYDADGNRVSLLYPNGVRTTHTYDPLSQLTGLVTRADNNSVVQSYIYTLDSTGNRTRIDEHDGTTRSYTYDALSRLMDERVTQAGAPVLHNIFVYDPVGNRLSLTKTNSTSTTTTTYAYDERDRLLTDNTGSYSWDANGNQLNRVGPDGAAYVWDYENRLIQVTSADGTIVRYAYDADGNRARQEVTLPGEPTETREYLVDTSRPLSQVVAEVDGLRAITAFYIRGGDELLASLRGSATRFLHADGLGSIRALTDDAGTVTDRYAYSAFGQLLSHSGNHANPYRFAGEDFESKSGFYYLQARWMEPETGRFASLDPFAGLVRDPRSLHKYIYALNNPATLTDPSGQFISLGNVLGALVLTFAFLTVAYMAAKTITAKLGVDTIFLDYSDLSNLTQYFGDEFPEFGYKVPEDVRAQILAMATATVKQHYSPFDVVVTSNWNDVQGHGRIAQFTDTLFYLPDEYAAGFYPFYGNTAYVFVDQIFTESSSLPTATKIRQLALYMANVASHEVGHSLFLGHEGYNNTIMATEVDWEEDLTWSPLAFRKLSLFLRRK
jgi:RHS repeat-associated protein